MSVVVVAKTVVINEKGEVLVLQRSASDDIRPGAVDFPGGGIEAGEDITAGAAREISEEAGLTVDPADLRLMFTFTSLPSKNGDIVIRLLFTVRVTKAEVKLSYEHDNFWWTPARDIASEFDHTSWYEGLQFALEHELLAPDELSSR